MLVSRPTQRKPDHGGPRYRNAESAGQLRRRLLPLCYAGTVAHARTSRTYRQQDRRRILFALTAGIVVGAAWSLWTRHGETFSALGLIVALMAMPIMTLLARRKIVIATELDSRAMRADAAESIAGGWLSLAIVWFAVSEAREAWSGEGCCDHDQA